MYRVPNLREFLSQKKDWNDQKKCLPTGLCNKSTLLGHGLGLSSSEGETISLGRVPPPPPKPPGLGLAMSERLVLAALDILGLIGGRSAVRDFLVCLLRVLLNIWERVVSLPPPELVL